MVPLGPFWTTLECSQACHVWPFLVQNGPFFGHHQSWTVHPTVKKRLITTSPMCGLLVEPHTVWNINMVAIRDEWIVSRNYRMPIYRTFQHIEKNIVLNLQYRVSRFLFILCVSAENSPKIFWKFQKISGNPKTLRKFRKFSENSENSPEIQKILRKFAKISENSSKRRSFLRP